MNNLHLSENAFPRRWAEEYRTLKRERDPEMFAQGLMVLGGRLEQAGEVALAARVYEAAAHGSSPVPRARERLEALQGRSEMGARFEVLLREGSRQVLDPSLLIGMTAASTVFRLTRIATLVRMPHGMGVLTPRVAANALAFSAEAIVFPLASRLASEAIGRERGWGPGAVEGEVASSFILMGGMRMAGLGTSLLTRGSSLGGWPKTGLLPGTFRQIGMLGGIMLGHRLGQAVGLWEGREGQTALIDSLAMLLQLNVGARLARGIFGEKMARWARESDRVARSADIGLPNPNRGPSRPGVTSFHEIPIFAGPLPGAKLVAGGRAQGPPLLLMEKKGDSTPEGRILFTNERPTRRTSGVSEYPPNYRKNLVQLLENPRIDLHPPLEGALADWLRQDSAFRSTVHRRLTSLRDPAFLEVSAGKGEISKILLLRGLLQDLRPERILFAQEVLRYNESLDPMLFELEWLPGKALRGNLYYPTFGRLPRLDTYYSGKQVTPEIAGPGLLRWTLFPKTSMELHVERKGAEGGVWEVRNSYQGILLSIPRTHP